MKNLNALRLVGATTVGLLAATNLAAPGVADPDHEDLPGIITFQRFDDDGQWQLWVANADLTGQRQLTSGPYTSGFASWNPDGTRLAFDSNRSDPDLTDDEWPNDVFTMNADGTDVVQVTHSGGFAGDPSWSPDGRWIAFESDFGDYFAKAGIWVSRPDGSHLRRVTAPADVHDGYWDTAPQFSPDGKRLVFTRFTAYDDDGDATEASLYVVDVDGTHARQLTSTADLIPGDANWSPNGKTLTFEAYGPVPNGGNVYTVGADGKHPRNLTDNDPSYQGAADPVYSPDGHLVMYLQGNLPGDAVWTVGLSTMSKNGKGAAFIGNNLDYLNQEHQPDWVLAPRLGDSPGTSTARRRHVALPHPFGEPRGARAHRPTGSDR